MSKSEKSASKLRPILIILITALILAAIIGGVYYYIHSLFYDVINIEAGMAISPNDFLTSSDGEASFTIESDSFNNTEPGSYTLYVRNGFLTHKCTLNITDTIAPEVEAEDLEISYGQTITADDFIKSITDVTPTTASFSSDCKIDYETAQPQSVTIDVIDSSGNCTSVTASLTVKQIIDYVEIEVGSDLPDASVFTINNTAASYVEPEAEDSTSDFISPDDIDMTTVAIYPLKVLISGTEYDVRLATVDTVAPIITVADVSSFTGFETKADKFIKSSEDVTSLTYSYKEKPDFNEVGSQEVTIVATDEGGNSAEATATLTLAVDDESPVFTSAKDFTSYTGNSISYKNKVSVSDNCSDGLTINVDSSAVNINAEGTYPVVYTATDASGNSTSVTINVTIKNQTFTDADALALCSGIISSITNSSMDNRAKCAAIYKYIQNHISYSGSSDKTSYAKACIVGFQTGKGDCFTYAAAAKYMLTAAGITNMDIAKIPSTTHHYWNLVDIGDGHGWYHFDTCPRTDHPYIFLWDEATLMEYSNNHHLSHNYDHSAYPTVL